MHGAHVGLGVDGGDPGVGLQPEPFVGRTAAVLRAFPEFRA